MTWIAALKSRFWPTDPRDDRMIDAQIDEELTFHIEQITRELVEAGQSANEAKSNALARFGNVDQIKSHCKRIALGERIMLQRINLVLMLVVLLVVAVVSVQVYSTQKYNTFAIQAIVADLAGMKDSTSGKPSGLIYVGGDVKRPGQYAIPRIGRLTLSRLISAAGGIPTDAYHLRVIRSDDDTSNKVFDCLVDDLNDLAKDDFNLHPDDLVIVEATTDGHSNDS